MDPIVRYFLLCDEVRVNANRPHCVEVECLMNSVTSLEEPPYPLLRESICAFLILTACRGRGAGQIRVAFVDEDPEQSIFGSQSRNLDFAGRSPLDAIGVAFVIKDFPFPKAGGYSVQFWYNDRQIARIPLELR